jgi:hypothetical protein
LKRFYRLEDKDDEDQSVPLDLARGQVLLESSDEEAEEASDSGAEFVGIGNNQHSHQVSTEPDIDLDETEYADLDAQAAAYQGAHPETGQQDVQETRRLAIVNLDWDHVRASHLFKICSSLVSSHVHPSPASKKSSSAAPPGRQGKVLSVQIFPSQFGKERLAREEREGPPKEIFRANREEDEGEINETTIYQLGKEDEHNNDALRKYQLERLRSPYVSQSVDQLLNCSQGITTALLLAIPWTLLYTFTMSSKELNSNVPPMCLT